MEMDEAVEKETRIGMQMQIDEEMQIMWMKKKMMMMEIQTKPMRRGVHKEINMGN